MQLPCIAVPEIVPKNQPGPDASESVVVGAMDTAIGVSDVSMPMEWASVIPNDNAMTVVILNWLEAASNSLACMAQPRLPGLVGKQGWDRSKLVNCILHGCAVKPEYYFFTWRRRDSTNSQAP